MLYRIPWKSSIFYPIFCMNHLSKPPHSQPNQVLIDLFSRIYLRQILNETTNSQCLVTLYKHLHNHLDHLSNFIFHSYIHQFLYLNINNIRNRFSFIRPKFKGILYFRYLPFPYIREIDWCYQFSLFTFNQTSITFIEYSIICEQTINYQCRYL